MKIKLKKRIVQYKNDCSYTYDLYVNNNVFCRAIGKKQAKKLILEFQKV